MIYFQPKHLIHIECSLTIIFKLYLQYVFDYGSKKTTSHSFLAVPIKSGFYKLSISFAHARNLFHVLQDQI